MGTLAECRCECGKLMARTTPHGLELKCRGCKRIITVSFGEGCWRVTAGSGAAVQDIHIDAPQGQRPASAPRLTPRPAGDHYEEEALT